jgi:hypothetical protein
MIIPLITINRVVIFYGQSQGKRAKGYIGVPCVFNTGLSPAVGQSIIATANLMVLARGER